MMNLEEQFNLTNKLKHPTNSAKVVYRFYKEDQAVYFAELLVEADIEFETQTDEEDERKPVYFGVARTLERKVDTLNYTALGKGRDKFIPSGPVRWLIIGLSMLFLLLAILGAILAR